MAIKHPKDRRIPRALLKTRMFKNSNLEDKVILGVHVLEFAVIIGFTVVAAAAAVFLPKVLPANNTPVEDKVIETVQEDEVVTPIEDIEVRAIVEPATLGDKKVGPRLD